MSRTHQIVIKTVEMYLGPTSERFVDRQITLHLKKDPHTLEPRDLPKLADWIRISMSVITGDQNIVEECVNGVLQAAHASSQPVEKKS